VQSTSIKVFFFLQKLEHYVFLVLFFSATPHTTMIFFAVHTNFLWQPDSIIRCKQAQQNNCRLAHTADYYPFFAMHMGIMLQPEGTLRCKLARQFVPAAIYQTMKFFLQSHARSLLQPEPTFANFRNHQNFFNILQKH
jgi:hypothetical protein